jgi:6-phosphofructokinase 1
LGFQVRCLRPSLIGRSASACVSLTDRREAWQVGFDAVNHLVAGRSGLMVNLERRSDQPYECRSGLIPLAEVAAAGEKLMSRALMNRAGNMISAAFWDYALPLIDGPLPKLARLQNHPIL